MIKATEEMGPVRIEVQQYGPRTILAFSSKVIRKVEGVTLQVKWEPCEGWQAFLIAQREGMGIAFQERVERLRGRKKKTRRVRVTV